MISANSQKEVWEKLNSIERRLSLAGGGGSFAPSDAEYVVMSLSALLPNERVLTAGVGLGLVDGGAGGSATLNVNVGIGDDDIVQVDGAIAINQYAKWTAGGLGGRTYSQVLSDLSGQALAAFGWNAQDLTNIGAINCKGNLTIWATLPSGNPFLYIYGFGTVANEWLRMQVKADNDAIIEAEHDLNILAGGGNIYFGNENLITTGTFGSGAITSSGTVVAPALNAANLTLTTPGQISVAVNIDTAADFTGTKLWYVKTAGASDEDDHFYGSYTIAEMNQAAATIGYLYGSLSYSRITAGNVGAVGQDRFLVGHLANADLDGGKVWGNAYGLFAKVDQEAGNEVTGNIYGIISEVDADGTVGGNVYMLYLDEKSNVDYGAYQSGTAPNVFGGTISSGANTDVSSTFGRTVIGHLPAVADYACFSHYDRHNLTNYAIIQGATGKTCINSSSGQSIEFRNNNSAVCNITADNLAMISNKEITLIVTNQTETEIRAHGITFKNMQAAGGLSRHLLWFTDDDDVSQFTLGAFTTGQTFNYGFIGVAYNDTWVRFYPNKFVNVVTGTPPAASVADSFMFYSADIVAGNAAPHFRTENDDIIKLYKYVDADFGNAINSGDVDTDDAISAIISALTAHGLIAVA